MSRTKGGQNMKKMSIVLFGLLVCMTVTPFVGTASAKTASSAENSVNAGFAALPGLFDTEATVFFVEYERKLGDKISILGRFGVLDYEFDDGSYTEDGDGPGFDVGVRFYPMAGAMEKLAGARESMLFCYGSLLEKTGPPNVAALRQEIPR